MVTSWRWTLACSSRPHCPIILFVDNFTNTPLRNFILHNFHSLTSLWLVVVPMEEVVVVVGFLNLVFLVHNLLEGKRSIIRVFNCARLWNLGVVLLGSQHFALCFWIHSQVNDTRVKYLGENWELYIGNPNRYICYHFSIFKLKKKSWIWFQDFLSTKTIDSS